MELEPIQNKIYEIRGIRVMLVFHLAVIYETSTKALKQAVKRNIKRFPPDFMFELTKKEWRELVTICDHIPETMKHSYIPPFAFTEHGVTMLSSVLRSDVAIDASILVVRAFVAVRQLVLNPPVDRITGLEKQVQELKQYIEDAFTDYNDINEDTRMQLELINQSLAELQAHKRIEEKPRRRIGYVQQGNENKE